MKTDRHTMIPKQAIEKAIEGGWLGVDLPSDSYFKWSEVRYGKNYTRAVDCAAVLDHSFWQALGRGCEWHGKHLEHCKGIFKHNKDKCAYECLCGQVPVWQQNAQRFYALVLTNDGTEKFWEEILK